MMSEQIDARKLLKQAGVKERMMAVELSTLDRDFYPTITKFLGELEGDDRKAMASVYNSLVMSRKAKIVRLAESQNDDQSILAKMAPEEKKYYDAIVQATTDFMEQTNA